MYDKQPMPRLGAAKQKLLPIVCIFLAAASLSWAGEVAEQAHDDAQMILKAMSEYVAGLQTIELSR